MRMTMRDKEARGLIRVRDIMIKDKDVIRTDMMTQAQVIKTHHHLMTQPPTIITMTVMIHLILRGDITHSLTDLASLDL